MKVDLLIGGVTDLTMKTRVKEEGIVTTVQFNAKIPVLVVARLLNLQRQGVPLLVTIGSPQAFMDLIIEEAEEAKQPSRKGA